MAWVSRFIREDEHFDEVPGCPLRGARSGHATTNVDENACARCRYNVCFPKQATIGCTMRTPADVVERARRRADPAIAATLKDLRAAQAREGRADPARWRALGERWLATAAADDDEGREIASVIVRFASAAMAGGVDVDTEILR
jgi:hypothetical protein